MFHPLITPLTTYMYTTDIQDNGTVSATDAERLPPGGFSLRHGFPDWFGRGRKLTANAGRTTDASLSSPNSRQVTSAPNSEPRSDASADAVKPSYTITRKTTVPLYDVLKYLRSTFDTEEVLDAVPLDAAGNPGAWHAWRTHRRKSGKLAKEATASGAEDENVARSSTPDVEPKPDSAPPQQQARNPSDWNWDGVWELRVKRNIAASLSEPVLYGGAATGAAEDVVRKLCCVGHGVLLTSCAFQDPLLAHGRGRRRIHQVQPEKNNGGQRLSSIDALHINLGRPDEACPPPNSDFLSSARSCLDGVTLGSYHIVANRYPKHHSGLFLQVTIDSRNFIVGPA